MSRYDRRTKGEYSQCKATLTTPTFVEHAEFAGIAAAREAGRSALAHERPWLRPGASRDEREAPKPDTVWLGVHRHGPNRDESPRGECSEMVRARRGRAARAVLKAPLLAAAGEREEVMALVDTFESLGIQVGGDDGRRLVATAVGARDGAFARAPTVSHRSR